MANPRRGHTLLGENHRPDGLYGWSAAFGLILIFVTTVSHYTAFGFLFGNILEKFGYKITGTTLVMNTLAATINFTGLGTAFLLRVASCRVLCVIGGLLFSLGLMFTACAENILLLIIVYSILPGIGLGLLVPAAYRGLNSYCIENHLFTNGITQMLIGLGYVLSPPVTIFLLEKYGFRGTMLLVGGFALNSIIGSMLFQPINKQIADNTRNQVRRKVVEDIPLQDTNSSHLQPEVSHISMAVIPEEEDDLTNDHSYGSFGNKSKVKTESTQDMECDEHIVISRRGSLVMSAMMDYRSQQFDEDSQSSTTAMILSANKANRIPTSYTNVGFNLFMFDNLMPLVDTVDTVPLANQGNKLPIIKQMDENKRHWLLEQISEDESDDDIQFTQSNLDRNSKQQEDIYLTISSFFDSRLLKDPVYLNILFGLSISFVSDNNFFTILPFYLISQGFKPADIGLCVSIHAGADIAGRIIMPLVAKLVHTKPRTVYLLSCLTSAIARSYLAIVTLNFTTVAVVSGVIGFLKGSLVMNISHTIGQHCTTDQFAAGYALYIIVTGLTTLSLGSSVGMLIDATGNFPLCIHILSGGLILCSVMWLLEFALSKSTNENLFIRVFHLLRKCSH